ncbi:MAG: protein kinase domain-containing protein [Verrucomicrobiota bacterium]
MNTDTQREAELFDEARRMPSATARRDFLARACDGDDALRARIEGLLEAETEADRFFAESGAALALSAGRMPLPPGEPATVPGEEPIGARIGRYKLLEKIGEGGWGVVYRAEQQEPVRRAVALKIIKLGMETRSVVARFEAERQALAMMDHPNIARVYDAGATDRGPPYFVMELVRGVKITTYCDQHRLGLRERLDLFILVCHAIQHAHQKGIIHGDIKPSNIMVSLHDGIPVPKVIDFGIAKATEARLTDRLLFTAYAQLIGTPAYMSPEQTDVNNRDTDTRSDIYSLGVLLYELLTGLTPFDAKQLLEGGLDEMRRILREKEPPRPSARLGALRDAELARTAADRRVETHRLAGQLRGDLDWIAMKCLEKDRSRRYETANGLAMDIQRHLNNEPVMARPPSRLYRFRKLVRRNRVVFAAGGAVAAALVAGLGTSTWLFLKEREAHQRALAAEQQQARLRAGAELREKISSAALLVTQERFEEADKLLNEIPLVQPTVEGAAVLRSVTEWHALRLQWRQAAARALALLQVNPLDGSDVSTLDYLRAGPVLIELGDINGYERFRQEAIARYTAAPCPFADRIVKVSLLLPANERLIESLRPLAEETARHLAEADKGGDDFTAAWRSVALGLLEYRRGNHAKAAEWSRRCLDYPGTNAPRTATARIILAMAGHRIGRSAEARAELAAGREVIEHKFRNRLDFGSPVHGFWFDWVFARILLRECSALLEAPGSAS